VGDDQVGLAGSSQRIGVVAGIDDLGGQAGLLLELRQQRADNIIGDVDQRQADAGRLGLGAAGRKTGEGEQAHDETEYDDCGSDLVG